MGIDFIGFAVFEIDTAAVRFVTGNAGAEMLIHVGHPLVIRLAILVFTGVWIQIAPAPKVFDKLFALLIGLQLLPGIQLSWRDNGLHVSQPINKSPVRLRLNLSVLVLRVCRSGTL